MAGSSARGYASIPLDAIRRPRNTPIWTPAPVKAEAAERKLRGSKLDDPTIRAASEEAIKGLHPTSDIHGSSEYRIALLQTMTQRALTIAAQRARSTK